MQGKTDRELLELAARAAGYAVYFQEESSLAARWKPSSGVHRVFWNPLSEDGDAFRLSSDLKLTIYHDDLAVIIKHKRYSWEWLGEMINEDNEDRLEATRRAIVRAAAEIGAKMQAAE